MKPFKREERFGNELKKIVGEIFIREFDTSEIGLVTITQVKVTGDLKIARVYFSVINRKVSIKELEKFFRDRKSHIRKLLGTQLTVKSVPDLEFYYDEIYEKSEQMERLFDQIKHNGYKSQ